MGVCRQATSTWRPCWPRCSASPMRVRERWPSAFSSARRDAQCRNAGIYCACVVDSFGYVEVDMRLKGAPTPWHHWPGSPRQTERRARAVPDGRRSQAPDQCCRSGFPDPGSGGTADRRPLWRTGAAYRYRFQSPRRYPFDPAQLNPASRGMSC